MVLCFVLRVPLYVFIVVLNLKMDRAALKNVNAPTIMISRRHSLLTISQQRTALAGTSLLTATITLGFNFPRFVPSWSTQLEK